MLSSTADSADTIKKLIREQYVFFQSGATLSESFRRSQLKKLKQLLQKEEENICKALYADLGKQTFEAIASEIEPLKKEIDFALKHLEYWMRPQKVASPWLSALHFGASSYIYPEPYGLALVISPWNYPLYLSLAPAVAAIAAGNTVVIKPSEHSQQTSDWLLRSIAENFSSSGLSVVTGEAAVSQELLSESFDYIFFTGGERIAKIVMKAAAEHLTPVTLELGGKSPCILSDNSNLKTSMRRILWGKLLNSGQTCVAPDYLMIHEKQLDAVLMEVRQYLKDHQSQSEGSRIINEAHLKRLVQLVEGEEIKLGGAYEFEHLKMQLTIVVNPTDDSPLMQEEIFGPILPILTYRNFSEAINRVKSLPKPLALYLFSNDSAEQNLILEKCSAGGVMINDVVLHLTNPYLPFGGVGASGMGSYHGRHGFETFSHFKSVEKKSLWPDFAMRYPPYPKRFSDFMRRFL